MSKINFGRVLLGGIVAGIVLNIGEFILNEKIMGAEMKEMMAKHNFVMPIGPNFIIMAVGMTFVLGIVMVCVYALIRPRLGPGPKAAIVAALIMWFGVYLYNAGFFIMIFGSPVQSMAIANAWGLVEYSLASTAGAWIYKEA
jgi:hypothetical protein